ncbi:unnamed protein product [Arabidopsis lyrata]|nr:unnamed protein product [Arabidopsis lyrata]
MAIEDSEESAVWLLELFFRGTMLSSSLLTTPSSPLSTWFTCQRPKLLRSRSRTTRSGKSSVHPLLWSEFVVFE